MHLNKFITLASLTLLSVLTGCGGSPQAPSTTGYDTQEFLLPLVSPNLRPLTITRTSVSAADGDSLPSFTTDGDLGTYWTAQEAGAWIRFDLGAETQLDGLELAFFDANLRTTRFSVEVSLDGVAFTKVLEAESGRTSTSLQYFGFSPVQTRYVRVVSQDARISLAEAAFKESTPIAAVSVRSSSARAGFGPQASVDRDPRTHWAASGRGEWIRYDLGASKRLSGIGVAFHRGDVRQATFDIAVSDDGQTFRNVASGLKSSGSTLQIEPFLFGSHQARFVRVTNSGNSENADVTLAEVSFLPVVLLPDRAPLAPANPPTEPAPPSDPAPPPTELPPSPVVPAPPPSPVTPYSKTYYLDCSSGSDSFDGTSEMTAWKSLAKANTAALNPGEALLLKRNCRWDGQLSARWNGTASAPVTIGAYGTGELPRIRTTGTQEVAIAISGTHQVLEYLEPEVGNRPTSWLAKNPSYGGTVKCPTQAQGWRVGFALRNSDNVVQHSRASGFTAAIHFSAGTRNKALYNTLTNNDVISTNTPAALKYDDDSGAWGVLVNAHGNEIAYNTFSGNLACSEDYAIEGASVEVYKGSQNYVHHNQSIRDTTFTELGGTSTEAARHNIFERNLYVGHSLGGEFLVLRGSQSKWGDNLGTKAIGNTAVNVKVGVSCGEGCDASVLELRQNVLQGRSDAGKSLVWTDGVIGESENVFWPNGSADVVIAGRRGTSAISSTSRLADPQFVDVQTDNYRRQPGAPVPVAGFFPML